jgi:hypothetical protein
VRLPIPPPGHVFKLDRYFNGMIQRVNGDFNKRFIVPFGSSRIESNLRVRYRLPVLPIPCYLFEASSNKRQSLTQKAKPLGSGFAFESGAQERTRTSTVLPPLGPEPSASTNFATWAGVCTTETAIIATASRLSSISRKPPGARGLPLAASIDTPLGAQYGC